MFATLDEPQLFLRHDLDFHRAVAAGSGNPILAAIIGAIVEIIWESGRIRTRGLDLRDAAETHRRIYKAIRSGSAERARREMTAHLDQARFEQGARRTRAGARGTAARGTDARAR